MARINDETITSSYQGILGHGETVLSQTFGKYSNKMNPLWVISLMGAAGYLLFRVQDIFLIATDKRLILIHNAGNAKKKTENSILWQDIQKMKVGKIGNIFSLYAELAQIKYFFMINSTNLFAKSEKENVKKLETLVREKLFYKWRNK